MKRFLKKYLGFYLMEFFINWLIGERKVGFFEEIVGFVENFVVININGLERKLS